MWQKIKGNIKNNLFSGLLLTVPLIITIIVLRAIFNFFDRLIYPLINQYYEVYIPGLGIAISLILIYLVGVVTKNYVGKKVVNMGEQILTRIPLAKTVYTAVKQILITFGSQDKTSFKQVLLVEYPRKGVYSVGFLNGELRVDFAEEPLLSVLVMTSINPTSGYLVLVPRQQAIFTRITVEQAMKMIVSGGIVLPDMVKTEDKIELSLPKTQERNGKDKQ